MHGHQLLHSRGDTGGRAREIAVKVPPRFGVMLGDEVHVGLKIWNRLGECPILELFEIPPAAVPGQPGRRSRTPPLPPPESPRTWLPVPGTGFAWRSRCALCGSDPGRLNLLYSRSTTLPRRIRDSGGMTSAVAHSREMDANIIDADQQGPGCDGGSGGDS